MKTRLISLFYSHFRYGTFKSLCKEKVKSIYESMYRLHRIHNGVGYHKSKSTYAIPIAYA